MKKIQTRGLVRKLNRLMVVAAVAVAATAGSLASAQIVTNGNFQTDDSSSSGYAGYGPIVGFTSDGSNDTGLNGYDIHFYRNASSPNEVETQFAPSGYSASPTTDPRDFAFIQNSGGTLMQTLTNLNFLTTYQVTFLVGQRSSDVNNIGTVSVTGGNGTTGNASVTGQAAFTQGSFTFSTGLGTTGYVLTLANTTPLSVDVTYPDPGYNPSQDRDVDFADIVITDVGRSGFVPEPSTYALLGLGALGLAAVSRRAKQRA